MAFWALRSFEDATSFIAEVIFSVDLTDPILSFVSLNDAICYFCLFFKAEVPSTPEALQAGLMCLRS